MKLSEEEAESQKLEIRTALQTQRQRLEAKLNVIVQQDKGCAKAIKQTETVKRDVQRFADGLIKFIQMNVLNIITMVENQTKETLESLTTKRSEIQHQLNVIGPSLDEADKLLKGSTCAEVVQLKKSLQTIFHGVGETEPIVHDLAASSLQPFFRRYAKMSTVKK